MRSETRAGGEANALSVDGVAGQGESVLMSFFPFFCVYKLLSMDV